jgi:hypothetical protein
MLLDADVQAGLVVDRAGALRGMIRLSDIADWMRRTGVRALDPTDGGGPGRAALTTQGANAAQEPG